MLPALEVAGVLSPAWPSVFIVISGGRVGLETRRPSSPLIDIKPIEFGVLGAKKEPIQPSVLRRTYTPDDYFRKFEPRLYSLDGGSDDVDFLTDEEISSKYQLGMLHFSTQYDLLHNHLTVRVIEARDLPPPIAQDGARQDLAHSNPYVKVCLLPDQKNSKQTAVKRKTQRPVFEERYTFEIPFLEAQRRTLLLTVLDFDKFSRHCVIGKVAVPLCEVDLVKGGHWWKALIPSSQVGGARGPLRGEGRGGGAGSRVFLVWFFFRFLNKRWDFIIHFLFTFLKTLF